MIEKTPYEKFVGIIEMDVLVNIDKAFHGITAECPNPKQSYAICKQAAEYLKGRLDGYVDAQASIIGQMYPDKANYNKSSAFGDISNAVEKGVKDAIQNASKDDERK